MSGETFNQQLSSEGMTFRATSTGSEETVKAEKLNSEQKLDPREEELIRDRNTCIMQLSLIGILFFSIVFLRYYVFWGPNDTYTLNLWGQLFNCITRGC